MKPQLVVLFYGLAFAGLVGTGAMIVAWHLTPPNPDPVTAFGLMLLLMVRPLAALLERPVLAFPGGFEGLQLLLWALAFASVLGSLLPVRHR